MFLWALHLRSSWASGCTPRSPGWGRSCRTSPCGRRWSAPAPPGRRASRRRRGSGPRECPRSRRPPPARPRARARAASPGAVCRRTRATAARTSASAFSVAATLSVCTQEACSRMFTIWNWYGLTPPAHTAPRNVFSCRCGEQDATTIRFELMVLDVLLDQLLPGIGTHVLVLAGHHHAGELPGVLRDGPHVHRRGDVAPAVADVDSDPHGLGGTVLRRLHGRCSWRLRTADGNGGMRGRGGRRGARRSGSAALLHLARLPTSRWRACPASHEDGLSKPCNSLNCKEQATTPTRREPREASNGLAAAGFPRGRPACGQADSARTAQRRRAARRLLPRKHIAPALYRGDAKTAIKWSVRIGYRATAAPFSTGASSSSSVASLRAME